MDRVLFNFLIKFFSVLFFSFYSNTSYREQSDISLKKLFYSKFIQKPSNSLCEVMVSLKIIHAQPTPFKRTVKPIQLPISPLHSLTDNLLQT